ncbi:MAG: hypothetical protein E7380_04975 [Clostridiales bacterium]|nr:hypothetical protein [Clostridiales bacterium]
MTTNKTKAKVLTIVLSCVFSVLFVLAIVLGATVGFNGKVEAKTLTVTIDQFAYDTKLEKLEDEFDKVFDKLDVTVLDKEYGEMAVESEILYIVDKDTDVEKVKAELRKVSKALVESEGADIVWEGGSETVLASVPSGYITRAIIAGAVFAVAAFLYVTFRYRWDRGIVACLSVFFALGATTAIVLATRIPANNSTLYGIMLSGLIAAAMVLFNFNKIRTQEENEEEVDAASCSAIATKKIAFMSAALVIGLALLAVLGGASIAWACVCAILGVLVSAAIALVYAPNVLATLKDPADANAKAKGKTYKGASKTSERIKKIFSKFKKSKSVEDETEETEGSEEAEESKELEVSEEETEETEEAEEVEEVVEESEETEEIEETVETEDDED